MVSGVSDHLCKAFLFASERSGEVAVNKPALFMFFQSARLPRNNNCFHPFALNRAQVKLEHIWLLMNLLLVFQSTQLNGHACFLFRQMLFALRCKQPAMLSAPGVEQPLYLLHPVLVFFNHILLLPKQQNHVTSFYLFIKVYRTTKYIKSHILIYIYIFYNTNN